MTDVPVQPEGPASAMPSPPATGETAAVDVAAQPPAPAVTIESEGESAGRGDGPAAERAVLLGNAAGVEPPVSRRLALSESIGQAGAVAAAFGLLLLLWLHRADYAAVPSALMAAGAVLVSLGTTLLLRVIRTRVVRRRAVATAVAIAVVALVVALGSLLASTSALHGAQTTDIPGEPWPFAQLDGGLVTLTPDLTAWFVALCAAALLSLIAMVWFGSGAAVVMFTGFAAGAGLTAGPALGATGAWPRTALLAAAGGAVGVGALLPSVRGTWARTWLLVVGTGAVPAVWSLAAATVPSAVAVELGLAVVVLALGTALKVGPVRAGGAIGLVMGCVTLGLTAINDVTWGPLGISLMGLGALLLAVVVALPLGRSRANVGAAASPAHTAGPLAWTSNDQPLPSHTAGAPAGWGPIPPPVASAPAAPVPASAPAPPLATAPPLPPAPTAHPPTASAPYPPMGARISPDQHYWWDTSGRQWRPVPVSPDGRHWYDGSAWRMRIL